MRLTQEMCFGLTGSDDESFRIKRSQQLYDGSRKEFSNIFLPRRCLREGKNGLNLPLTSSSSIVVLESVDSFSFTCDPSLFFVIMLLPLHIVFESWGERREKVDYDNEMSKTMFLCKTM